jgi:peptidylprolyl isomerase
MEFGTRKAKEGDTVHVHYTGSLEDGTIFDSSDDTDPIEMTIGAGQVIPGFEEALIGMGAGEQKIETIGADRAYGDRREELVFQVDRGEMPPGNNIEVGDFFRIGFDDGRSTAVQITAIDDSMVTLDANHPLAGKTLVFELELVSID